MKKYNIEYEKITVPCKRNKRRIRAGRMDWKEKNSMLWSKLIIILNDGEQEKDED